MSFKSKKVRRWLLMIIVCYTLVGVIIYFFQDVFLFHPKKLASGYKFSFQMPFGELRIPLNKKDTLSIVKFFPTKRPARGIVIYFHGNMENVEHYAPFTQVFTDNGYEVWMPDYPGFGKSTGKLTEEKLYAQALIVQNLAVAKYHNDSIIIYGKSLGTGIASFLATKSQDKMLILETPYSNIPDVFYAHIFIYPTDQMISYKIPTSSFLDKVKIPVTIIHGTSDWIIPYYCATKLKDHLKNGDKFITIEGANHHDINQKSVYYQALDSLLTL